MQRLLFRASSARAAAFLLCVSVGLSAQTPSSETPQRIQPGTVATPAEPEFPLATPLSTVQNPVEPLSFAGKADYFMRSALSPQSLARIAFTTGLSQVQGSAWEGGLHGYSDHLQARYYEHLTRRGIQFAVGAARGEDPRFFRSGREGFWPRTKFVLSRTVVTQMDNGSTSIAVGKLVGMAGGNFASSYWRPDDPTVWKHTLSGTGVNLGGDVAMRMIREFWPDIKKKFLKKD